MVTTIRKVTGGDHPFYEFACLSTDTKPTSLVPENSICHEIDTGKHFYCSNGEWKELPPKGGSGGGGLPDNFPAEGSTNANKFLGFDANGGYTAKDAPSGGGAEKFVVTLTQESDTWTAADGVTIADIVAADAAGKIVEGSIELSADTKASLLFTKIADTVVMFAGVGLVEGGIAIEAGGVSEDSVDSWFVYTQTIPTSTNAPLIVTMTADQQNPGTYVGDKTFAEIHAAATAGRTVVFAGNFEGDEYVMYCSTSASVVEGGNTVYLAYYNSDGDIKHFEGGASDYPSFS